MIHLLSLETALAIICTLVVLVGPAVAQQRRPATSFGPYVERLLEYHPLAVAVSLRPGELRPVIATLSTGHPTLHFYRMNDAAELAEIGTTDLPAPQELLVAGAADTNGHREFFTLGAGGTSVTAIREIDGRYTTATYRLPYSAQRLVAANIDNDSTTDLLLFGRSMTGVGTLLGRHDGTLVQGPLLFPEISVSDLRTTDLNGDGIADVILLDWLSNRLVLYYGITRGIFSEQISLTLPGEPADIAITPLQRRRTVRVAVTLPQAKQLAFVTTDAAGEMTVDATVDLNGRPSGVQLALVNQDPWFDAVTVTDKGLMVALGTESGAFQSATPFGPGAGSPSWTIADVDGDHRADVVLVGAGGDRLVILGNASRGRQVSWPDVYAVGPQPKGIAVLDVDGDGRADVCVANAGASTVSVLLNRPDGKLSGQVPLATPDDPAYLTLVAPDGVRERSLVTSHPDAAMIGVVRISPGIEKSDFLALPTNARPAVLFAREDSTVGGLVILVRTTGGRGASLSLFEQISSGQFLERSIHANIPETILALTLDAFAPPGGYDLALVTNNPKTRMSTVSIARGSGDFGFGAARPMFSYPDSLANTRIALSGFINSDAHADLVLGLGPPRNAIAIAYGNGDGSFADSLVWIPGIQILRDDEFVIRDVNRDGIQDLVLLDGERNAVVAVYGTGRGTFGSPVAVAQGKGVTGLAVASLRKAGEDDLILSHGDRGTISILYSAFTKGKR